MRERKCQLRESGKREIEREREREGESVRGYSEKKVEITREIKRRNRSEEIEERGGKMRRKKGESTEIAEKGRKWKT